MKNDRDLEKDIQDAFQWDPLLKTTEVAIIAHEGVVTLSGIVESYNEKLHVENIAKSIDGVKVIIEHITVKAALHSENRDEEIAKDVLQFLKLSWVPLDRIKVKVENGHVTLEGQVTYNFQKEDAKKSVGSVKGVVQLTNNLELVPETRDHLEKRIIEHALLRYSATVGQNIRVKVEDNMIYLNGTVESIYQKEQAEKNVWNAPGVLAVKNELIIE
jgi:osmotically-inducible protein OsmY